tara:strand:+ start:93 stop:437 length:345 start_codon:yes stop_codon:yes gene_type:complete
MKSLVNKPWGSFRIIDEGKNYLVKKILVKPKGKLSLQSHNNRHEHWTVVNGIAEVLLNEKKIKLDCNQSIYIPKGSKHSLENKYNEDLIIIEVWYGENLSEEDIIRYEDIYGRV